MGPQEGGKQSVPPGSVYSPGNGDRELGKARTGSLPQSWDRDWEDGVGGEGEEINTA